MAEDTVKYFCSGPQSFTFGGLKKLKTTSIVETQKQEDGAKDPTEEVKKSQITSESPQDKKETPSKNNKPLNLNYSNSMLVEPANNKSAPFVITEKLKLNLDTDFGNEKSGSKYLIERRLHKDPDEIDSPMTVQPTHHKTHYKKSKMTKQSKLIRTMESPQRIRPRELKAHHNEEEWKIGMQQIDDQESINRSESFESSGEEEFDFELTVRTFNIDQYSDNKAIFMIRTYKALEAVNKAGIKVPELNLKKIADCCEGDNSLEKIEGVLIDHFEEFINKSLQLKDEAKKHLREQFDELYLNYGINEPNIVKFITIIQKLAAVGFGPSEDLLSEALLSKGDYLLKRDSSSLNGNNNDAKSLLGYDPNALISQEEIPTFEDRNNEKGTLSKFHQSSAKPIKLKTQKEMIEDMRKELLLSTKKEFFEQKDNDFFRKTDHVDTGIDDNKMQVNDSPAKSCRSTTSKLRRRQSAISTTLQRDVISMKNSKLVDTKNFDANLLRGIRPIYIFDDDWMPKIKFILNQLLIKKEERFQVIEMAYFREDLIFDFIRRFEDRTDNSEYLIKARELIKHYMKPEVKKKNHIRLAFEDTMSFLNRVGIINDIFLKRFRNMFKYSSEDVMAIYEVFILTKDFADFVENLNLLSSSKYSEKNQLAKNEIIQGEKMYLLLNSIELYVEEYLKIYYSVDHRRLLPKLVNEANDDLIKFIKQNESLTKKLSHQFSGYVAFNINLRNFLDKQVAQKYMKKISIRMEKIMPEKNPNPEQKNAFDKFIQSDDFRVA